MFCLPSISLCRNLPHCVTEADSRQICAWWVSGQQRSGHQRPSDHWRAEGQQTAVLPKPVTLHDTHPPSPPPPYHHITCALLFLLLCSWPTPSVLLLFSLPFIVLYRTSELTRALLFCHEKKTKNFKSLYVTWSVELFSESMWRFLQCRDEAVVAVTTKPVKLIWTQLKLCGVQGGWETHFNGYH